MRFTVRGIDFEIFPWLKSALVQHPSLECVSATYGHGLIPLMHPVQQKWEVEHGPNTHRVTFFPEFYTPKASVIPDMFFVLGPHTVTYVLHPELPVQRSPRLLAGTDPESFAAIRYGGKVGLVMKGFDILLGRFFAFQRDPYGLSQSPAPLSQLLKEIERIAKEVAETVIVPLDVEAPYIESLEGEKIWRIFLDALKRSGLNNVFVSIEDVINDTMRINAEPTDHPHRELAPKWFGYEAQFDYYSLIREFEPKNEREYFILSLAGTSDALSSLYRKITSPKRAESLLLSVTDAIGRKRELRVGDESNNVFEICQSAWFALRACLESNHKNTATMLVCLLKLENFGCKSFIARQRYPYRLLALHDFRSKFSSFI